MILASEQAEQGFGNVRSATPVPQCYVVATGGGSVMPPVSADPCLRRDGMSTSSCRALEAGWDAHQFLQVTKGRMRCISVFPGHYGKIEYSVCKSQGAGWNSHLFPEVLTRLLFVQDYCFAYFRLPCGLLPGLEIWKKFS